MAKRSIKRNTVAEDLRSRSQMAIDDLARRLNISAEWIRVVSDEDITWPNGSLGCSTPGVLYTAALVPGYQIILSCRGKTYDYHGAIGRPPFLCDDDSEQLKIR